MSRVNWYSILIVVILILSGCNTIKFNNLTPGTRYEVGDVFTSDKIDIVVEPFSWGSQWTYDGTARVDDRQYSGGSGIDMNTCNVNLLFEFDYPRDEITLKFADCGGNNNITINSEFLNFGRIIELDGQVIGGVSISVTAAQDGNNWFGELILTGVIDLFKIGGQELWIDDVHY
jgi:hypothetical protein